MRLHLIDGTYELFRAHFSKRPELRTRDGQDVKATAGVVQSLLALLRDPREQVTHLAVAFDNPIRSFRNELFAGYKTEEGVPPELLAQFDLVEQACRAIGLVVWSMKAFEADDALSTGAARWASEVEQVRICSPDKDLGQCIVGTKVVQVDRMRQRVLDEAAFLARYGFPPGSMPDFLALVGDTADGIPGLDGFGEKSAGALLSRYRRLEDIPRAADQWQCPVRSAPRLCATLLAHFDDALLYRRLATLRTDVPLEETLEELRFEGDRQSVSFKVA